MTTNPIQVNMKISTLELLQRNQENRITTLESKTPSLPTVLKANNNANQQSITNVNNITSNSLTVQNNISSLNNGQLIGFSNVETYKINSGIVKSHSNLNILSFPVPNNNTGVISGSLISTSSNLDFEIFCKSVSNSVSINSTIYKGYSNSDSLSFSHSGNNIIVAFHNNMSINQKYVLKYSSNFIGN